MLGSLATAASFVFFLCLNFEPRWETSDDVGMSMFAHGYGLATIGSPNIFFSNVLWGKLVRAIPTVNSILGYSIATLGVLVIVGTVVIYGLYRLGAGYLGCLLTLTLILVRPVLFPQFTINAGLLLVGALICWHLYARQNDWRILGFGCLLAFCSYLVRELEFLLVLIVALPLLPWRAFLFRRAVKIAFLALVSAIVVTAILDRQAYQGDEWQAFNDLNTVRASFTDFGAGKLLKQHQDILERHGYSINDLELISNWFFVDPHIANPQALRAMLTELGPLPTQGTSLINAWIGVQALWHPKLLPLVLAALLLVLIRPSWQIVASWGLCTVAIFVLGLLGRPGVLRVYVPLVCLLVVAPFLAEKVSVWHHRLSVAVLLVAASVNAFHVFSESNTFQIRAEQTRKELDNFPNEPAVIWGGAIPFTAVYPVLRASSAAMSYRFYGLGVDTLAPNDLSFTELQAGRGMTELLVKEKGISIIANKKQFGFLEVYCREHLHGQLKELFAKKYGKIVVSQRRCEIEQ